MAFAQVLKQSSLLPLYRPPKACIMVTVKSFSSWPTPFVDSNGNYAQDTFLESSSSNSPLYQHQHKLPRLPVPTLQQTIDRFLPTALPLAETEEEVESLQQACRDFLQDAQPLQERLLKRQQATHLSNTSWLQEWWNTLAYLQFRQPVVVHVSYFFQLAITNDPSSNSSWTGIQQGAAALRAAAQYRLRVCSSQHPQDTIGKKQTPLCSVAYKYMFHACRIPKKEQDLYRMYDPVQHTHAIVACRNQFFSIPLLDDNNNGQVLPLSTMEANLRVCQQQAQDSSHNTQLLELGWLSTWNRDYWATARETLLSLGEKDMQQALSQLESGMLVLCLDDEEPVSYRQRALEYWHGGTRSGGNRWFDKSIQLVVSKNGKIGFIGEHSMMDGMPAVGLCNYIKSETYQKQVNAEIGDTTSNDGRGVVNIFQEAFENLSEEGRRELQALIANAKQDFVQLVDSHELQVESFQGYGSNFIKKAGFSPDAYVQMAIQLATYRLFGKQVATYESTQVRPFLHGRTEVTRSVSPASQAFVERMGFASTRADELDENVRKEKLELFRKATVSHVVFIRKAVTGQGCDRHLFGLSLLVEPGETPPELFSHPLYLRSKRWRVSTSTLPNMPGFGPVEEDGVGIAYEIKPNSVMFTVTSGSDHALANPLCHLLEEALVEIQSLIELEEPQRSKL